MSPETILTLVASPVLGGAAAKLWQWWTTRDAAKLAAEAEATRRAHEADAAKLAANAAERSSIVELLRQQLAAGDERGERGAARAAEIAAALAESAAAQRELTRAIEELRAALMRHADEELDLLRPLAGGTGEHARASVIPAPPRPPVPPLPADSAPPRRVP